MFKPSGTVTGLYREDYLYNPTANAFVMYRDVWRERQSTLTALSNNSDDEYNGRINGKKKDVN